MNDVIDRVSLAGRQGECFFARFSRFAVDPSYCSAARAIQSRPDAPRFVFTGSTTNITLPTGTFAVQATWSNKMSGCAFS